MRIVILSQYFQGGTAPGISLLYDMAVGLKQQGDEIFVVAGRRGYMDRKDLGAQAGGRGLLVVEEIDGIRVIRPVSGEPATKARTARLLGFLLFPLTSFLGLVKCPKPDVVFGSSPPLFAMLSAWIWSRLTGTVFVLEVRDLWPESAVALGAVQNRFLIWLSARMESFLYQRADGIVTLTAGIADEIRSRVGTRKSILVSRYAIDPEQSTLDAAGRDDVRRDLGWHGDCVAIYAGNLGYANGLDMVLEAAASLKDQHGIRFVLIGDGANRSRLERRARDLGITRIDFMPPVSKATVTRYLAAADIGLATLMDHRLFDAAIPTKLIDYMAAGLPVVAPRLREIGEIVSSAQCGLLYRADSPSSLADAIAKLADARDTRRSMGAAGRREVARNFSMQRRNEDLRHFLEGLAESGERNRR